MKSELFSISGNPLPQELIAMEFNVLLMVSLTVLVVCSSMTFAKTAPSTSSPTPAPAPAPHFVNLTELLTLAGPFSTYLSYLEKTKVIDVFQNQANNSKEGITIFVPQNSAFSSTQKPSLTNLTSDQLMQLFLFHALPHYYSLADFKNLSLVNPVSTFAGAGSYSLNITDDSGTVGINSGLTKTKVSSSMYSTNPVAVYQVDEVLLPKAIFGTDIPPTAASAPAPNVPIPIVDSPSTTGDNGTNTAASPDTNTTRSRSNAAFRSARLGVMSQLCLAISGLIMLFL
ncbi:hypothetical protein QQ045_008064 [Rhodiola kirilowii]